MLIALLLQAAIAASPAPSAQDAAIAGRLDRNTGFESRESVRRRACNQLVIHAMGPGVAPGVLYERGGTSALLQEPLYNVGELPDEGFYAAVARQVNGCPVPTPIHLRNAQR